MTALLHLRFILGVTSSPLDELVPLARHAEACGFDTLSVSDHLALPMSIASPYPYSKSGAPRFDTEAPWSDPWVAISAMATATVQLRFLTNIFVLPLRDPFTVAKAVGSAAVLSGGRVSVGIGVGWLREEFALTGQDFTDRGARTDEMIEVLRLLWRPEVVEHHGRFYDFAPVRMAPAPPGGVPILIGGESTPALDRAARLGDGYISLPHRVQTLVDLAGELAHRRDAAGRASEPFQLVTVPTDAVTVADHERLAAAGVGGIIKEPWGFGAGPSPPLARKLRAMSDYS
jgi:probable F420-dependent oxidoreductase